MVTLDAPGKTNFFLIIIQLTMPIGDEEVGDAPWGIDGTALGGGTPILKSGFDAWFWLPGPFAFVRDGPGYLGGPPGPILGAPEMDGFSEP